MSAEAAVVEPTTKMIALELVRLDGGTQSREKLDQDAIESYSQSLSALPPMIVFYDGSDHWLADGFHRWHGYQKAGRKACRCEVRSGSLDDAKLFAAGPANCPHDTAGLRRTRKDKRRCIAIAIDVMPRWSDRAVADHVGCSKNTVASVRCELVNLTSSSSEAERLSPPTRIGSDGKERTAKPKRKPRPKPSPDSDVHAVEAEEGDDYDPKRETETWKARKATHVAEEDWDSTAACCDMSDAFYAVVDSWPEGEPFGPLVAQLELLLNKAKKMEMTNG